MLPINPDSGGTSPEEAAYTLVGAARTSRVVGDNNIQDVISVTAQSKMFLVTYTWFVDPANWNASGAPGIVGTKTAEVNVVCAHDHVIGFRTMQDQDASRLLVNYAIITVGTDDGGIQDENSPSYHPVRMDQLGTPAPFNAIDAVWGTLAALGTT